VTEVWDTQEQFEAFGKRLLPILDAAGIGFSAPPEILPVHNIARR
jgi:hypothetical protein